MAAKKKTNRVYKPKNPANNILIPFESQASSRAPSFANRRSSASKVSIKDQLCNIDSGILPFHTAKHGCISVRDAIELCQKAYFNVGVFRNTIDTQSEFANSPLHFRGGSERSRKFFKAWYKKIKGQKLSQQFFLEWYRSSNIFLYKTFYKFDNEEIQNLKDEYSSSDIPPNLLGKSIPLRYILLNPTDIATTPCINFSNMSFYKILNSYELDRLKNPTTKEEEQFLNSLPPETRKEIKNGSIPLITIDPKRLTAVFAKKQDYEAMSVPMYYPVLFDINMKLEFKKAEIAIARQIDYMILLITMGDKENGVDAKVQAAMQEIFKKDSVGRVIISDYTTKMEFVIPDFNKIMGPEKYEVVNRDISNGLMNVFFEESKFASGMIKTKIFLERLNEARKAYINDFLIPEMELIADELSLRDIPKPQFEQIDIQDETQIQRVYARLVEIGVLTPDEFFEASDTGILPTKEDSIKNQKEYKDLRDEGLYSPLVGGAKVQENGRPEGVKTPQSTKTVSPQTVGSFSLSKMTDSCRDISKLIEFVEDSYKSKFGFKRLSTSHKNNAFEFTKQIISHESKENWESSISKYIDGTTSGSNEITRGIDEIAATHNLDTLQAAILFHSTHEHN